jgi:hypothetical protein
MFRRFELDFYGRLDLGHFCAHKDGIAITFGMVFHEDIESLFASVFTDEISGALW